MGKSTLVRMFAARQGLRLCEVNLERHLFMDELFGSLDVGRILRELEILGREGLAGENVLLFLDEVQATPRALQALRYLYEERPELPVLAAGSLLEFTLARHAFPMPVGRVEYHHLGPMSFEEYLLALRPELLEAVRGFRVGGDLPEAAHRDLLGLLREFLTVGGMPEAVQAWREEGSFLAVDRVHRSLAGTYQDDFSKYGRAGDLALMQRLFLQIPRSLGRKVIYARLAPEARGGQVREVLDLFAQARICHKVLHSHATGVPLLAEASESIFKLVFLDVGLVSHLCGNDVRELRTLDDRRLVNEGSLAEQFVGQHLAYMDGGLTSPSLTYWLREGRSSNAEVDYVVACGPRVVPVEVKAGTTGSLKSLQQFVVARDARLAVRFDLGLPSVVQAKHRARTGEGAESVEFTLLSLPLYLVGQLRRLVDEVRQ